MFAVKRLFVFLFFFFFFNDTAPTEIYPLSLHDALPISYPNWKPLQPFPCSSTSLHNRSEEHTSELQSHSFISYAVFCLKKKKKKQHINTVVNPPAIHFHRILVNPP